MIQTEVIISKMRKENEKVNRKKDIKCHTFIDIDIQHDANSAGNSLCRK